MAHESLGAWKPLDLREVVGIFKDYPARWWIGGGRALELHADRSWRTHDDIDVGVLRDDAPRLAQMLQGWDIQIAAAGVLTSWNGSALVAHASQNNLWCRKGPGQPWCLDVTIGEEDQAFWVFRRDPSVHILWEDAVLRSEQGVPYLAPELQLLFQSKDVRQKDESDAAGVIPALTLAQRSRLRYLLPDDHPWQVLVNQ